MISSVISVKSSGTSPLHHITLRGTPFEDIEPIDEMHHEITCERVRRCITNIVGCHTSVDVASLLQDIIYLETNGAVLLFKQRLLKRSVPEPFVLFITIGIARVGGVVDITFQGQIPWQIDRGSGIAAVIEVVLILLRLQAVGNVVVVHIAPYGKIKLVGAVVETQHLRK